MSDSPHRLASSYDVIIVGGGPAGTTCAQYLKRAGFDVIMLEKGAHPRFCVGESLLPNTTAVWRELDLIHRFEAAGFVKKYGAYFTFADGTAPEYFHFPMAANKQAEHAYHVPRAEFDELLWKAALEQGAVGADHTEVIHFVQEGSRIVGVDVRHRDGSEQRITARLVMDASGRHSLLSKQLGLRVPDLALNKVAIFTHYEDIFRSSGDDEGTIGIVATDFGWMWLIPFAGNLASCGAVMHNTWFAEHKKGRTLDELFDHILELAPAMKYRLQVGKRLRAVDSTGNFSYRSTAYSGDGWVLVGDASSFLDPVFSSGVHLAMTGSSIASKLAIKALANGRLPTKSDFRAYESKQRRALHVFSRFIYNWYDPAFREIFMRPPHGRPGVEYLKKHIISVLAGDVFDSFAVLPAIYTLLFLARMRRILPGGKALPAPALGN